MKFASGKVFILLDLIAKGMHVSLHRSLFRAVFDLQQGAETGERASKRVISVPCRERAGDRVTGMQNDRKKELHSDAAERERERERVSHLSETFNRVKCEVLV